MQAKWHVKELKESSRSAESHVCMSAPMAVSLAQIQRGDIHGRPNSLEQIINPWHGVGVELRDGIQLSEVDEGPQRALMV